MYPYTKPSTSREIYTILFLKIGQNKLQEVERVVGTLALQNGDTQGAAEDEKLDSKGGPQRCLLYHFNASQASTISKIFEHYQFTCLSLSLLLCPMDINQCQAM